MERNIDVILIKLAINYAASKEHLSAAKCLDTESYINTTPRNHQTVKSFKILVSPTKRGRHVITHLGSRAEMSESSPVCKVAA